MGPTFPSLSWWLWSGKKKEPGILNNIPSEAGLWESALRYPMSNGTSMVSLSRRVSRRWHRKEQRKVDKEYDVVLVPSDGGCVSGSDSDDSDWSVGWLEPHGPEFWSDDDMNNSFAVLVPCYGKVHTDIPDNNKTSGNVNSNLDRHSDENMKSMVLQFSSLQDA